MLDISLNGGSITITTDVGIRDFESPYEASYSVTTAGYLRLQIQNFKYESALADLTISGDAPADAAAVRTALRTVFPDAGGATGETNLEAVTTDIIITDSTKGLVLKSPNGNQHRISINNDGSITTTQL